MLEAKQLAGDSDEETAEQQYSHTLSRCGKACIERAGGDIDRAVELLKAEIRGSRELMQELLGPYLDKAARNLIRNLICIDRKAIIATVGKDDARGLSLLQDRWLDYQLSGGVYLRNATVEKLETEITMHKLQARGNLHKARWLELVKGAMKGKKTVGEALDGKKIEALYVKAEKVTQ